MTSLVPSRAMVPISAMRVRSTAQSVVHLAAGGLQGQVSAAGNDAGGALVVRQDGQSLVQRWSGVWYSFHIFAFTSQDLAAAPAWRLGPRSR